MQGTLWVQLALFSFSFRVVNLWSFSLRDASSAFSRFSSSSESSSGLDMTASLADATPTGVSHPPLWLPWQSVDPPDCTVHALDPGSPFPDTQYRFSCSVEGLRL